MYMPKQPRHSPAPPPSPLRSATSVERLRYADCFLLLAAGCGCSVLITVSSSPLKPFCFNSIAPWSVMVVAMGSMLRLHSDLAQKPTQCLPRKVLQSQRSWFQ
ncbi:hypothetical protein LINPERHAP1_LOCUS35709 [Linum perenne]